MLGANGAGKSTLLRIMAGVDQDFAGEAFPAQGYTVGFLPQEPVLDPKKNVLQHVEEAVAETRSSSRASRSSRRNSASTADEMEKSASRRLQDQIDAANAWELDAARDRDGRAPAAAGRRRRHDALRRRAPPRRALPACCSRQPDLLLLDEPTNHLDAESVAWLERHLQEYKGTVVAITHDRYFLDNVAGWILELDRGAGIPWEGNYSSWLEQKEKRLAQEEKEASSRRRTLERELEWVRMAPRARQAKGKARLTHYEELLAEEQAAEKRDDDARDHDPARAAPRRPRDRGEEAAQGLRRQPADGRRRASCCRAAASSA